MIHKIFIFLIFLSIMTCCLSIENNTQDSTSLLKYYDIHYDSIKGIDPKLNSLDIYTIDSEELKPIMIYVHGGAWRLGDKTSVGLKPIAFTEKGFVFISINYRLSPNAKFPAHAQDVAKAITWIYANAEQYGGDKKQIYLMGHSAGAHLVTLVSTDERYLKENNLTLNIIKGVISLDAVYDLDLLYKTYNNVPEAYILTFGKDPAFLIYSSPITYVEKDKEIPPMFIAYSGGGLVGSLRRGDIQSENFVNKLREFNYYSEIVPALDKSHISINNDFGDQNDYLTDNAFEFLESIWNN